MKMYKTHSGLFLRTQDEAKGSGEEYEKVDIPTDSHGLVAYLNDLTAEIRATYTLTTDPEASTSKYEQPGAIRTVSRMADGMTTDEVVELIMTCSSGTTLGRYAMAVSMRFDDMGKRRKK